MSLAIKRGDKVVVISGKDKGKSGKILKITASGRRAVVEGVNLVKKHLRRRAEGDPTGVKELPCAINISNLALFCSSCSKARRFRSRKLGDGSRIRVCAKCDQSI